MAWYLAKCSTYPFDLTALATKITPMGDSMNVCLYTCTENQLLTEEKWVRQIGLKRCFDGLTDVFFGFKMLIPSSIFEFFAVAR